MKLFSYGFRPLFLLAGLHALISVPLWALYWSGAVSFDLQRAGHFFHGHEMIAGFVAAAIGGFLLTAVANWTQRPPISGVPLVLLCSLWLFGRLAFNLPWLAAFADAGYWLLLTALVARELILAGNRRNYKILVVLAAFLLLDVLFHHAELTQGHHLQQMVWLQLLIVVVLINLIGGRIIPAFTGNWLKAQAMARNQPPPDMPVPFNRLDLLATVMLLVFVGLVLVPDVPATVLAISAATASILQFVRLSRWKGLHSGSEPLVWMMHLAWLWIPVGLALWALALFGLLPVSAALHALAGGAVAGMVVAVSSRAALGHTGHDLRSPPMLTAAVLLLHVAALLRVLATIIAPDQLLVLAALLWFLAFATWLWCFVPVLVSERQT